MVPISHLTLAEMEKRMSLVPKRGARLRSIRPGNRCALISSVIGENGRTKNNFA
jgi:hypothetical protein